MENKKLETKGMDDMIRGFAAKEHITIKDSKQLVESFLELIEDTVIEGNVVNLRGFGKFYSAQKASKAVIHPTTKKRIILPAYVTMLFKASDVVKDKMNEE